VGKSTLFNRLAEGRHALVHDRPGVTRDRNYATAAWEDRSYLLIDTGGFDPQPEDPLYAAMRRQSEAAMAEADVVLFLLDRQSGITPADLATADLVRQTGRPVVVAVNKCDTYSHDDEIHAFWELGFSELVGVSAEHGRGMFELMSALSAHFPPDRPEPEAEGEIRVAVIGRPNIGKSTLLNALCREERHVVDNNPGTTVDATDSVVVEGGTRFRLVDTAGIRRKSRIYDRVEELAVGAAIRTIERCHVVLLMLDGTETPGEQDARLAGMVLERGRAMIVVVNKWDKVRAMEERDIKVWELEQERKLPHTTFAPVLFVSALTGKGLHRILPMVEEVYGGFNQRISTAKLNDFLRGAVHAYGPPLYRHSAVKLNYITQVRVRPPTFTVFCNHPEGVVDSYQRYLQNRMREIYGFKGTPLVFQFRKKRHLSDATTVAPGHEQPEEMEMEEE
jgi:GTP-binding protein